MSIKFVDGSVTAPKGFVASGVHCGIRKNKNKRDLALIYCEKLAVPFPTEIRVTPYLWIRSFTVAFAAAIFFSFVGAVG